MAAEFVSYFKVPIYRNKDYTNWVKKLPSCISGQPSDDPHHRKGGGGGMKVSDLETIPLTRTEHSYFHHVGYKQWEREFGDQRIYVLQTLLEAFRQGVIQIGDIPK